MSSLFFRPNFEDLTHYVSSYLKYAVDNAENLGFHVIDLYADMATRENFIENVNGFNPYVIVVGTHGLEDELFAQGGDLLLKSCFNDQILKGRLTFALACKSATSLGYSAVSKDCLVYFGWLEDFVVILDESYPPLQDPYAYSFLHPILDGLNSLFNDVLSNVDVQTIAKDVYETVTNSFNKEIDYWRNVPSPTASQMITYLIHDRDTFIPITATGVYTPPEEVSVQPSISFNSFLAVGLLLAPLMLKK